MKKFSIMKENIRKIEKIKSHIVKYLDDEIKASSIIDEKLNAVIQKVIQKFEITEDAKEYSQVSSTAGYREITLHIPPVGNFDFDIKIGLDYDTNIVCPDEVGGICDSWISQASKVITDYRDDEVKIEISIPEHGRDYIAITSITAYINSYDDDAEYLIDINYHRTSALSLLDNFADDIRLSEFTPDEIKYGEQVLQKFIELFNELFGDEWYIINNYEGEGLNNDDEKEWYNKLVKKYIK